MERKDPTIEKQLDDFLKAQLPDKERTLALAREEMRLSLQEKERKKTGKRKLCRGTIAAAACCVLLALILLPVLGVMLGKSNNKNDSANIGFYNKYTASELNAHKTDAAELTKLGIGALDVSDAAEAKLTLFVLSVSKRAVLLQYKLRYPNPNGFMDDLTILYELTDDMIYENNFSVRATAKAETDGLNYGKASYYENGEYVTYASLQKNGRYAMAVLNPREYVQKIYLRKFFID